MRYRQITLKKPLSGDSLEQACITAAKESGLNAKARDHYKKEYVLEPTSAMSRLNGLNSSLGYNGTTIMMRKYFIPLFEVDFGSFMAKTKTDYNSWFSVLKIFATEKRIRMYLENLSQHI